MEHGEYPMKSRMRLFSINYKLSDHWEMAEKWLNRSEFAQYAWQQQRKAIATASTHNEKKKMKSSLLSVGFNWNEMSLRTVNTPDMVSFVVVVAFLNKPLAHSRSVKRDFFSRIASHHFFLSLRWPCWLNAKTRFSYKRPERHKTGEVRFLSAVPHFLISGSNFFCL